MRNSFGVKSTSSEVQCMKNEIKKVEDNFCGDRKSEKYNLLKSSIHAVRVELNRTMTSVAQQLLENPHVHSVKIIEAHKRH